ncbi:MAG: PIN domain-containing protein [Mycobacteriales bacterium]
MLDTSAAIACTIASHPSHRAAMAAAANHRIGLAGHAVFETYSVLTRLSPPYRLTAASARHVIGTSFPHSRYLTPERAAGLIGEFTRLGITGGAVYDALIGACAVLHRVPLLSFDARAGATYAALGVDLVPIETR